MRTCDDYIRIPQFTVLLSLRGARPLFGVRLYGTGRYTKVTGSEYVSAQS